MWCDNIGLVSLIYLGWEFMCGAYYSVMHTTHPDLVCLLFVPSLYSMPLSNLKNFFIYLSLHFLCSVTIVEGILCIRFVHMCVTDSIVRKCVPVKGLSYRKVTHSSVLCYESA